jgi:TM2 domain-containing membrane protein YozV
MNTLYTLLPDADIAEYAYINQLLSGMSDEQTVMFATMYRSRRKDPQMILLLTLLGFVFFAGIHRFVVGKIGTGILWFFTGGLLCIGTIVDVINYKKIATEYNQHQAYEVASIMRSLSRQ